MALSFPLSLQTFPPSIIHVTVSQFNQNLKGFYAWRWSQQNLPSDFDIGDLCFFQYTVAITEH